MQVEQVIRCWLSSSQERNKGSWHLSSKRSKCAADSFTSDDSIEFTHTVGKTAKKEMSKDSWHLSKKRSRYASDAFTSDDSIEFTHTASKPIADIVGQDHTV